MMFWMAYGAAWSASGSRCMRGCNKACNRWTRYKLGSTASLASTKEPALIEAIRRDPRVTGSDDEIIDTFCAALDEGWEAQQTV